MQRFSMLALAIVLVVPVIVGVVPDSQQSGNKGSGFFGPACALADMYGAIAYSRSSDCWGTSYNYRSRSQAEGAALSECCSSDCEIKTWFRNACGALATGDDGSVGWGWYGSRSGAESIALRECQQRSSGCRVRCWACTSR